jgi:acrosin
MSYTLDGRDGNDTFNVGTVGGNAEGIDGALSVIGNNGTDAVSYNDLTAAGDPGYTLTATQLIRSFNATLTYATTESMRIDAGAGNNSILLNDLVDARDLVVNGNGGNDSIQVELNVLRFAATPPIAVDGGAGTDLVTINTTLSATGTFGVPTVTNNAFTTPPRAPSTTARSRGSPATCCTSRTARSSSFRRQPARR